MKLYRPLSIELFVLLGTISCQKETFEEPELPKSSSSIEEAIVLTAEESERLPLFETEMYRSPDEILAIAERVMAEVAREERQTKAASPIRRAVLTDSIVIAQPTTKNTAAKVPCANIYLVNFDDQAGFAWIAGDKRVRTAVLAYNNSGKFDRDTDNPGAQLAMEYMETYVQEEVGRLEAMRGDSIYRVLETKYGFGTPNRSTSVDFVTTKAFQQPPVFDPLPGIPGSSPDNPYGTREGSDWRVVQNGIIWYWAPVDRIVDAESSNRQEMMTIVYPMTPAQWHQWWPYNVEVVKENPGCPVGCVATAMAQIMAYHKKPTSYMWDSYGYNLSEKLMGEGMYEFSWESKSSAVINNVGQLFKKIGLSVDMKYAPSGSGAHSIYVPQAFSSFGYSTSSLNSLDLHKLCTYLESDKQPVYTRGSNTKSGHAWVVDGLAQVCDYRLQYKDCYYQGEYVGHIKVYTVNFTINEKYLHCNWGWGGNSNGWYLAGTFNPSSNPYQGVQTIYVYY